MTHDEYRIKIEYVAFRREYFWSVQKLVGSKKHKYWSTQKSSCTYSLWGARKNSKRALKKVQKWKNKEWILDLK